jgi:alpha-L-rhamnosidase
MITRADGGAGVDWNGLFIEPEGRIDPRKRQNASYLRREFRAAGPVRSAVLHASACGLYVVSCNGRRVGDELFTPGCTFYRRRLQYQTFDVTALIRPGDNAIGAVLGDGWYRGQLGLNSKRNVYGTRTRLLVVLEMEYTDGTRETVTTDAGWKATQDGPLGRNDLKDGEEYDARREMPGWDAAGFDDSGWHGVRPSSYDGELAAAEGERIVAHEKFSPAVITTPDGATVLDFHQNMSGCVEFTVAGRAGHVVRLRHGETLDEKGNFTLGNLNPQGPAFPRQPDVRQEITFTLKDGRQTYVPSFTVHGFRYVKLTDWPEPVRPGSFSAIAVYSDLRQTGSFECSNPLVNRLVSNTRWSQKSNFLDIPTDCPTRERAGWTGDIAAFCETGSYLMDTQRFLQKWLRDLALQQSKDGRVPNVVPDAGLGMAFTNGSAGWGDAAVIVPHVLYRMYGDTGVLERQYRSMSAWMAFLEQRASRSGLLRRLSRDPGRRSLIDTGFHWGEWLEPGHVMAYDMLRNVFTTDAEVATAYYAHSARLMAEIAGVLGKEGDSARYRGLEQDVRAAYRTAFAPDGRIRSRRQCRYVRPVAFDLLDGEEKRRAVEDLDAMVVANGCRIGTGFLSTPFVLSVLSDNGHAGTAYGMLESTERPGWLYAVRKGATTIWENWNGIDDAGRPTDSMNHYAFGAVVGWLFSRVAGIRPLAPGFARVLIAPCPGGSFTYARCSYESSTGRIRSDWRIEGGRFILALEIPVDAEVRMPDGSTHAVGAGAHALDCPWKVRA